jgi:vacuolar-type H+-ATPase subunit I/STV1
MNMPLPKIIHSDDSSDESSDASGGFCHLDLPSPEQCASSFGEGKNVESTITSQFQELQHLLEKGTATVKKCNEYFQGKHRVKKGGASLTDNVVSIVKLTDEKNALIKDNMEIRKQLAQLQRSTDNHKEVSTNTEPDDTEATIAFLKTAKLEVENQSVSLERNVKSLNNEKDELKIKNDQMVKEMGLLQQHNQALESKIFQMQEQLNNDMQNQQQIAQLTEELESTKLRLEGMVPAAELEFVKRNLQQMVPVTELEVMKQNLQRMVPIADLEAAKQSLDEIESVRHISF